MNLIGTDGNVATLPFYKALSIEDHEPLNNDGNTDNVPDEITGEKQTCMLIQRMKAWKEKDFTKELTLADPIQHVANSIGSYYGQVWVRELMGIMKAVLQITGMESHISDIAATGGTVAEENKVDATTLVYAQQKALGDMANGLGLYVMHSMVYARYKALDLVKYNKYTIGNALQREVTLPTINGLIPIVMDRYTVDVAGTVPVYSSYIVGRGAFLTCQKSNYEDPFYLDYDPEASAGVRKLYTKQGKVIHPNGISIAADNIVAESPTYAELTDSANWSLKFKHKNVKMGVIKSNG